MSAKEKSLCELRDICRYWASIEYPLQETESILVYVCKKIIAACQDA